MRRGHFRYQRIMLLLSARPVISPNAACGPRCHMSETPTYPPKLEAVPNGRPLRGAKARTLQYRGSATLAEPTYLVLNPSLTTIDLAVDCRILDFRILHQKECLTENNREREVAFKRDVRFGIVRANTRVWDDTEVLVVGFHED